MRDPELISASRRRLLTGAVLILGLVVGGGWLVGVASAQGIGGWSQSQGDAAHTGSLSDAAQPPYRESWRLDVPPEGPAAQFGLSQPVVDGASTIAVGSTQIVAADLATGRRLWTVDRDYGPAVSPGIAVTAKRRILIYTEGFGDSPLGTSATPSAGATGSPSPSPTGSDDPPFDSLVTAIDLDSRQPVWDASVQLDAVSRTGVTISGDTAFLGDNAGNVYAVAVSTGELRWKADAGGFLTTSPAVSDGLVIVTVQGDRSTRPRLVAFQESDGSRAWDDEIPGGAVLASSPAIRDGQVVVGFSDQTVRAFDVTGGAQRWSARLNSPLFFTGAPVLTPDAVVVVDTFGQVYRLDPATGGRVWDYALNEAVTRSPGVVAGGNVLVATSTGRLAAVDLESGLLVWQGGQGGGLLRSLALSRKVVVGVTGGARPGLVGFAEDPEGSLVSLESPTELDLIRLLLAFLAAAVPLSLLSIVAGRWLLARMGPAFLDDDDGSAALADDPIEGDGSSHAKRVLQ